MNTISSLQECLNQRDPFENEKKKFDNPEATELYSACQDCLWPHDVKFIRTDKTVFHDYHYLNFLPISHSGLNIIWTLDLKIMSRVLYQCAAITCHHPWTFVAAFLVTNATRLDYFVVIFVFGFSEELTQILLTAIVIIR